MTSKTTNGYIPPMSIGRELAADILKEARRLGVGQRELAQWLMTEHIRDFKKASGRTGSNRSLSRRNNRPFRDLRLR